MPELEVSTLTLNRLSVYLRCLRELLAEDTLTVSSRELAKRYELSAAQFRKDLAHFGEFGIRGVGYDTRALVERLSRLLGIERQRLLLVVGMGNVGVALTHYFSGLGDRQRDFRVVGGVDQDPAKIGQKYGDWKVESIDQIASIVRQRHIEIGVLTVPAAVAQGTYDQMVAAGIKAILNFAPVRLRKNPDVPTTNVDIGVLLEQLSFHLNSG